MNRNIPAIPTIIFLLLLLNGIYLYVSKVEDILPTSLQQVVKSEDGTIWALMGDSFIDLGDRKASLSFSQYGFDYHVGQAIPLKSGEWILNVGAQSDYVKKAIERSLIEANDEYQASGSLLKCSHDLNTCKSWGEAELQFDRAFDGLELVDGRLLLFKAEKKRIFLVDSSGIVLGQLNDKEFWFGVNKSSKGHFFGLETSKSQLFNISLDNNDIQAKESSLNFDQLMGDMTKVIGPSKVVEHQGKYWLLGFSLLTENKSKLELAKELIDMTPSLLSIDMNTREIVKQPYTFRADAEIERIDDAIYFSDFDKHEIKRFDLTSETMGLVKSTYLKEAIDQDQYRVDSAKKSLYRSLIFNGIGALLVLVWLVIKAKPIKEVNGEQEVEQLDVASDYDSGDKIENRELAHIAKMFAKKKLTKRELALVAPFKKVGDDYVYYPQGIFGRGVLVPDAKTLVSLYKWNQDYQLKVIYFFLLPFIGIWIGAVLAQFSKSVGLSIFGISLIVLLLAIMILPAWYFIKRRSLTKDLIVHDHKLGFSDVLERTAKVVAYWQIWVIFVSGLVLLLFWLSSFFIFPNKEDEMIKLGLYLLPFVVLSFIGGWLLRQAKIKLDSN